MTEAERERVFNAGFDRAILATTDELVLKHVKFNHPQYLLDRRREYEKWVSTQPTRLPTAGLAGVDIDCALRFAHRGSPSSEAAFLAAWHGVEVEMSPRLYGRLSSQAKVVLDHCEYRLDFAIEPTIFGKELSEKSRLAFPLIGVELDGHDYHERTKEQVTSRNQRDRDLQRAGWTIFHFSGSELYRHPVEAVFEVSHEIDQWVSRAMRIADGFPDAN